MKISDEVLGVLALAVVDSAGNVRIEQALERKLYLDVNKVLEACGGKWNRKLKSHVFEGDATAHLETIIVSGEVTTKQDLGFFPTPEPLARALVELADVRPGHFVLEPSAGTGRLIDACLGRGAGVLAIERDQKMRQSLTAATFAIHDWSHVGVVNGCSDFMEYVADEPFDRVVMNPPFGEVGLGDHLDHVHHAFGMLLPGGVLVSVLPQGVIFRQDKRHREFREWATDESAEGWVSADLPEDSFKASGTGVRTCTLRLVRK